MLSGRSWNQGRELQVGLGGEHPQPVREEHLVDVAVAGIGPDEVALVEGAAVSGASLPVTGQDRPEGAQRGARDFDHALMMPDTTDASGPRVLARGCLSRRIPALVSARARGRCASGT